MNTIMRKTALGIAGLAFAGGVAAAPFTATPAEAKPANTIHQDKRDSKGKELDIKYEAQSNFYYCGPAATRNALSASGHHLGQDEAAKQLGTTEDGTNSAEDTTRVLNKVTGGNKYKTTAIPDRNADDKQTNKLADDIKRTVDDGRAVVANIAGTATDTTGGTHSFEGGHYISVVGYRDNAKTVKIADSANPNTASYWMATDNLADWIATRGYSA
ncbi:C39 family peptidase [Micromonospora sonneratiae]|uniref:C39 family peptidase n=1 Tax=Micromonospora sonneratiae TaxID=1184706 RepID=A0ABW3YNT5_9ACTN